MAKMGNKLIALCSAAIGIIYTAGYIVTEPTAKEMMQHVPQASAATQDSQVNQGSPSSSGKAVQTKYHDGTYKGQGSNRIGSVEVAVTIKQDKITSVQITNCDTSYSESYIDGLPQQVVDRQSDNVDVVSGATRSTEDFQAAVDQALQQAEQGSTS